jgi:hypothetical protein
VSVELAWVECTAIVCVTVLAIACLIFTYCYKASLAGWSR